MNTWLIKTNNQTALNKLTLSTFISLISVLPLSLSSVFVLSLLKQTQIFKELSPLPTKSSFLLDSFVFSILDFRLVATKSSLFFSFFLVGVRKPFFWSIVIYMWAIQSHVLDMHQSGLFCETKQGGFIWKEFLILAKPYNLIKYQTQNQTSHLHRTLTLTKYREIHNP